MSEDLAGADERKDLKPHPEKKRYVRTVNGLFFGTVFEESIKSR
jgi:hypothetical protein